MVLKNLYCTFSRITSYGAAGTVPGQFYTDETHFTCSDVCIHIKDRHHSSKETGCLKKTEADSLTLMEVKTTLAKDCTNFNNTCSCFSFSSAQAKYTSLLTCGSSWRLSGIVRCQARHRIVPRRSPFKSYDLNLPVRGMRETSKTIPAGTDSKYLIFITWLNWNERIELNRPKHRHNLGYLRCPRFRLCSRLGTSPVYY